MSTKPFCLTLVLCLSTAQFATAEPVSFRKDIAPLLIDNCLACHGPKKAEGGLRIDSFERVMKPADSELATITANNLEDSELYRRLITDDESERMPLDSDPFTAEQLDLFKRWIEEGANYDADDPTLSLAAIVPAPVHPDPPETYPNTMPITAVAFSPDGSQLIAGGYHELTLWNPVDGQLIRRIKNIGQRTYSINYSPDGTLMAVGCGAPGRLGETRLFNTETGALVNVLGTTADVILDTAFNPAGDRLAIAGADSIIRIFEVASGNVQLTITSHSDWVMSIAWSADGAKLASASRDKTSKVFDSSSGELLVTYAGHGQPVKGVAFHPDGAEVFSSGADNKVHRWKVEDGAKAADVASFGAEVYKLTTGGTFMFTASADHSVRQYELASHKEVRQYAGHQDWALSTAFHDGTKRIAAGGFDGKVLVWNAEDGAQITTFTAAPGYPPAGE